MQVEIWELAKAVPLPYDAKATIPLGDGWAWRSLPRAAREGGALKRLHGQQGVYQKNAMIGDRGTQCDSVFRACTCQYPYELVVDSKFTHGAYIDSYHCNLVGLDLNHSWAAARELAQGIRSRTDEYLGPSAWAVRELWASEAALAALPTQPPSLWLPQPEQQQGSDDEDDSDDGRDGE